MELYYIIAVTDRDRAGEMAELYQAAGLHLTLTKLGRGTAPREALSIYGLDATPKAIVSAVADGEMQKQIFKNAKRRMQIDIPGNGVMLAVPLKSVAGARTLAYLTDNREMGGKPSMEFAHELFGFCDGRGALRRSGRRYGPPREGHGPEPRGELLRRQSG